MKPRALVFDFDGLLLDTEGRAFQAWDELYREHGLPLDRWLEYFGREGSWFDALGHLAGLVGAGFDRDAVQARRIARRDELTLALDLMPGVRERIAEAKARGLKFGVASSSTSRWVAATSTGSASARRSTS